MQIHLIIKSNTVRVSFFEMLLVLQKSSAFVFFWVSRGLHLRTLIDGTFAIYKFAYNK